MITQEKEIRVLEYIEGELSPEEEAAFAVEMQNDPELAALLAEYQGQDRLLHEYYDAHAAAAARVSHPDLRQLPVAIPSGSGRPRWLPAMAAAAVLAAGIVGVGVWFASPGDATSNLRVAEAKGLPQAVTDKGIVRMLDGGSTIGPETARLKTPDGSYLDVALAAGSGRLEMNGNSTVSLSRVEGKTALDLERGEVLVWLEDTGVAGGDVVTVATPQLQATGRDSVFSVVRGLRGAEVSVLRGEVEVTQSGARRRLRQGESLSTTGVTPMPIVRRVSWSSGASEIVATIPTESIAVQNLPDSTELAMAGDAQPAVAGIESAVYTKGEFDIADDSGRAAVTVGRAATTEYLPDTTLSFVEVPRIGALRVEDNGASVRDLLKRTSLRDVIAAQMRMVGTPPERVEKLMGEIESVVSPEELDIVKNSLGGSISLGITPKGVVLLAEVSENIPEVTRIVEGQLAPWFVTVTTGMDETPRVAIVNNTLVLCIDREDFEATRSAVENFRPSGFATSEFLDGVRRETSGSWFTAAADLGAIRQRAIAGSRNPGMSTYFRRLGVANMKSIVAASNFSDQAENRALRVNFDGEREGAMNWLGEPAPLGATRYFSPDTNFLSAARIRKPETMLNEVFAWAREDHPRLPSPQDDQIVGFMKEVADTLGNEVAIGLDNPVLPVPNLKIVVEVLQPERFHTAMLDFIDGISKAGGEAHRIEVDSELYANRLIVDLQVPGAPFTLSYAIIGDYAVFGPGRVFLQRTIDQFDSGHTIDRESTFLEALPGNSGSHVSWLTYMAPRKSLGEATPFIDSFLKSRGIAFDVGKFDRQTGDAKPVVMYAVASGETIDFYVDGIKGASQMTSMIPGVADWLSGAK